MLQRPSDGREQLVADTGYFSERKLGAGEAAGIEPLIALKRDPHHPHWSERFSEPRELPAEATPVARMTQRLKTRAGKAAYALRKQTVSRVKSDRLLERAKSLLNEAIVEFEKPDGIIVQKHGISFSYGIGADKTSADLKMKESKRERKAKGKEPPGVRRIPAKGEQNQAGVLPKKPQMIAYTPETRGVAPAGCHKNP